VCKPIRTAGAREWLIIVGARALVEVRTLRARGGALLYVADFVRFKSF